MLETIGGLPKGVWGLRAKGTVSKEDYLREVVPHLERVRSEGSPLRILYHFGEDFERMEPGAVWEDLRVGVRYFKYLERGAIVSDLEWLRRAARTADALLPCSVRSFENREFDQAVKWLGSPPQSALKHRIDPALGVLLIEPKEKLVAEDFAALAASVEGYRGPTGRPLHGVVIRAGQFPGWRNLGSFFGHLGFVRDQQTEVRRVALAVDGKLAEWLPKFLDHVVKPEIKWFGSERVDEAFSWAGVHELPAPTGSRASVS